MTNRALLIAVAAAAMLSAVSTAQAVSDSDGGPSGSPSGPSPITEGRDVYAPAQRERDVSPEMRNSPEMRYEQRQGSEGNEQQYTR
jgi:hypothetical protein